MSPSFQLCHQISVSQISTQIEGAKTQPVTAAHAKLQLNREVIIFLCDWNIKYIRNSNSYVQLSQSRRVSFFLFCSPVQFVIAGACVLFPQKKKNSKKEGKGDSKHKKKLCFFSQLSLPLDFSLLSSVLLFELNHKFLPR